MKIGSVRPSYLNLAFSVLISTLLFAISTNAWGKDFRINLSKKAVVAVEPTDSMFEPTNIRSGSGFFVEFDDSIVLVTNYLRMQGNRFLWVELENGDHLQATHLRYDPYWGVLLALVNRIDENDVQPLHLAEPTSTAFLNSGDRVEFVCGKAIQKARYVQGHVLPKSSSRTGTQSALLASTGSEPTRYFGGGPVLNKRGEVLGMTLDRIDTALDPNSETKVVVTSEVLRDFLSRIDAEPGKFEDAFIPIENWYEVWASSEAGKEWQTLQDSLVLGSSTYVDFFESVPDTIRTPRVLLSYFYAQNKTDETEEEQIKTLEEVFKAPTSTVLDFLLVEDTLVNLGILEASSGDIWKARAWFHTLNLKAPNSPKTEYLERAIQVAQAGGEKELIEKFLEWRTR